MIMLDTQGGYSPSTTHLTRPVTISPMLYIHLSSGADKMGQFEATIPRHQPLSQFTIKKSTFLTMAPPAGPLCQY
jgi:hypothetical protein